MTGDSILGRRLLQRASAGVIDIRGATALAGRASAFGGNTALAASLWRRYHSGAAADGEHEDLPLALPLGTVIDGPSVETTPLAAGTRPVITTARSTSDAPLSIQRHQRHRHPENHTSRVEAGQQQSRDTLPTDASDAGGSVQPIVSEAVSPVIARRTRAREISRATAGTAAQPPATAGALPIVTAVVQRRGVAGQALSSRGNAIEPPRQAGSAPASTAVRVATHAAPTTHATAHDAPVVARTVERASGSETPAAMVWRRADRPERTGSRPVTAVTPLASRAVIQRQPTPEAASPPAATAWTSEGASGGASGGLDVNALVEQVKRRLLKDIAIERERRGSRRWP